MIYLKHFCFVLWICVSASLHAQSATGPIQDDEKLMLPGFCKAGFFAGDNQLDPGPESKRWMQGFGDDLWHVHHYCNGLVYYARAQRSRYTLTERKGLWGRAINEMQYMIRSTKPTFVLRPEILSKMGQAYLNLKKPTDADQMFNQSVKEKPNYWPAYAGLAESAYQRRDKKSMAKWADEGLIHAPDNVRLLELKRLANAPTP